MEVNHAKALAIKVGMVLAVMWIVLTLIFNVSFLDATLLGIILTLLAYFTGDMFVLPRMGNVAATVGDFVLSLVVLWGGLHILGYNDSLAEAFVASLVLAAGEWFYHKWLVGNNLAHDRHDAV
ncbi:DUF2512 family protein [Bacillus sp. FJAT-27245]|uniref:DUF2512 family protein n=1 Tax=Bacillus sp. FJAT-27245 TaxID=1684144 RepID=UPI0006A7D027|nr:DUF2512 family protein [Bacillus sp. FJAT-27245]